MGTISRRGVAGTDLTVSSIGLSLDASEAGTPAEIRSASALLRAARQRGITTLDLPEGPGAERLEHLVATAFPEPDAELAIIAQRSSAGLSANLRAGSPRTTSSGALASLAGSIEESNARLAPHRVTFVDWAPAEGEREIEIAAAFAQLGEGSRSPIRVRRLAPGIASTDPGGGPCSGTLSILDQRLARGLLGASPPGVGFFARDPLGSGRLDGSRLGDTLGARRPGSGPPRVRELEREFAPVLSLGFLTEGRRRTLGQAALRFVLQFPWVACALVPLPAPERLDEIARTESTPPLTEGELGRILEVGYRR
jgi:aryl-alcohol dehydrogenase-like predicted oxidoreductase